MFQSLCHAKICCYCSYCLHFGRANYVEAGGLCTYCTAFIHCLIFALILISAYISAAQTTEKQGVNPFIVRTIDWLVSCFDSLIQADRATHIRICTHITVCKLWRSCKHIHGDVLIPIYLCEYIYIYIYIYIYTPTHIHTHKHMYMYVYTYVHAYIRMLYIHAHTLARTCTHAHTDNAPGTVWLWIHYRDYFDQFICALNLFFSIKSHTCVSFLVSHRPCYFSQAQTSDLSDKFYSRPHPIFWTSSHK